MRVLFALVLLTGCRSWSQSNEGCDVVLPGINVEIRGLDTSAPTNECETVKAVAKDGSFSEMLVVRGDAHRCSSYGVWGRGGHYVIDVTAPGYQPVRIDDFAVSAADAEGCFHPPPARAVEMKK